MGRPAANLIGREFGCTYHLIRDAHGGVFLTQDGVMIAGGNLREIFDAENA